MKIAVIGSGISGLSAAHFLSKKHQVDLFEKDDHFGGHSYTVEIPINSSHDLISVDLGFIVFNKINYPNLLKLFNSLQVPYEKSNMSFSVSVKNSNKIAEIIILPPIITLTGGISFIKSQAHTGPKTASVNIKIPTTAAGVV